MHGSVGHIDMRDGFFDLIVSVMVLHHVEDLQVAMAEIGRVVESNGRVLIVDYSPDAAHELRFRAKHKRQDFFPMEEVTAVLESKGFSVRGSDFGKWYLVEGERKA